MASDNSTTPIGAGGSSPRRGGEGAAGGGGGGGWGDRFRTTLGAGGGGASMPPQPQIFVDVNGVRYTQEQWQLRRIEEKLDRLLALMENHHGQ
jgi:hypothetical protein